MTRRDSFQHLWIASGNAEKVQELTNFSARFFQQFSSIGTREPKGVIEDEPTFQGNAKLKAYALVGELVNEGHQNFAVLGDDSGLCIDLLEGNPGVRSGRYAGSHSSPEKNVEKVLHDLESITQDLTRRTGQYHCSLCLLLVTDGRITREYLTGGVRDGVIGLTPKGTNGYAYDAVFLDPQTLQSYGEISYDEKQKDSHRYRAFAKLSSLSENISK